MYVCFCFVFIILHVCFDKAAQCFVIAKAFYFRRNELNKNLWQANLPCKYITLHDNSSKHDFVKSKTTFKDPVDMSFSPISLLQNFPLISLTCESVVQQKTTTYSLQNICLEKHQIMKKPLLSATGVKRKQMSFFNKSLLKCFQSDIFRKNSTQCGLEEDCNAPLSWISN